MKKNPFLFLKIIKHILIEDMKISFLVFTKWNQPLKYMQSVLLKAYYDWKVQLIDRIIGLL